MLNVHVADDEIRFGDGVKIGFERTLRIPDDGREYPLPPGLDTFPLFRVEDYAGRVHPDVSARGDAPHTPDERRPANNSIVLSVHCCSNGSPVESDYRSVKKPCRLKGIAMPSVDLCFPVLGKSLPTDHGYSLYAAVARILGPDSHERNGPGLFPIRGLAGEPGLLSLTPAAHLQIRTAVEQLPGLLRLAGKTMEIDGHRIRLGVPQTYALVPAVALTARLVTIKGFREPAPFLEAARRQLDELHVKGRPAIPVRKSGPHQGEPTRRILRIRDKKVVGFALIVSELTAEESLTLQENGLGGRRHMGCGLFTPWRPRA